MALFTRKTREATGAAAFGGGVGVNVPVKPPEQQDTRADRLDWVCQKLGCRYEIVRDTAHNKVTVRVVWDEGERAGDAVASTARSVPDALRALLEKLGEVPV